MNNLSNLVKAKSSRSQSQPHQNNDERVQVRRISLAEFTGLESYVSEKKKQQDSMSPETNIDFQKNCQSSVSLIDTYSNRRRPIVSNTFDDIKCTELRKVPENELTNKPEQINFHDISERVENLRKQLEKAMNDLPNQSPRKSFDSENEKTELLKESRKLAGACKTMLLEINDMGNGKYWSQIIDEVLEAAEAVTHITERMIQKSNSIFQAQLMTTKTEQMLKSLVEVLQSIEKAQAKDGDSMKLLTARSTTLTANVRQLLSTVSHV
ncbi:Uncharacterized protein BM_BM8690 [Brugia malayi]|uniref:Bm8690 n=2 Tax=Brugia TaxID=6278 RepID=A0A4E9F1W7_BRUMA|nr:Uncharacterized protein BM_BM8690 [Brugia malayi]VIO90181.1 Uncharacterized protein BM_BM8690 [Brugia malayi]